MTEFLQQGLNNFTAPAILFFILGIVTALLKTSITFPDALSKTLSIYLMAAIGFKGGAEIARNGVSGDVVISVALAVALAVSIPVVAFYLLRNLLRVDTINSGAISAHYGSVSVVTFVTAMSFLEKEAAAYDGYMVGMMALMEFPAIFTGILLTSLYLSKKASSKGTLMRVLKDSVLNESVILLFGSLLIGFAAGDYGYKMVKPFFVDPFQGVLALFLLEMGLLAGSRFGEFKAVGAKLVAFAIIFPIINGLLGAALSGMLGLSAGNGALFGVLAASSSYIAAPAAVRMVLPTANPSYYITMSLAVTFPFNILFGIPLYSYFAGLFA